MEKELNNLLSKPASYYKNLILKNNPKFDFKKPVILFGSGNLGKEFLLFFKNKGTKVVAFSDNNSNKIGKLHYGIEIIDKKEISIIYGKNIQIVASCAKYYEVIKDLKKVGFINLWNPMYFFTLFQNKLDLLVWKNHIDLILKNKAKIKYVLNLLQDRESKKIFFNIIKFRLLLDFKLLKHNIDKNNQYFNLKIIKLTKEEIFLDGGAFDGDTIKVFIKKTNNHFSKVFAFEPDKINFSNLNSYIEKQSDDRIKSFKLGVGDKEITLSFSNDGNVSSKIVLGNNTNKVKIVPIDKFKELFTYIKLDIEGYEKNAILGAKKTLVKNKPKLAICAYHYIQDLWKIPLLINKINSNYKIFFRRYSDFLHETVCYAI